MRRPANLPYGAASYDLGICRLAPISDDDGETLGVALAAIDPWRRMGYAAGSIGKYLVRYDPAAHRFAIRADGEVVGAVSIRNPWLRGPYLELLGLLPGSHRRGIGRAVMSWFEAEAPPGAANLWVVCSTFNSGALSFYTRCGFSAVTTLEDLVVPGFNEILLRKSLGPRD